MVLTSEIRAVLAQKDDQFRRLNERHRELERELERLRNTHPAPEDLEIREALIKKQKLRLKDQMLLIAKQYPELAGRPA